MIWKEERKMVKNYYFIKNKEFVNCKCKLDTRTVKISF